MDLWKHNGVAQCTQVLKMASINGQPNSAAGQHEHSQQGGVHQSQQPITECGQQLSSFCEQHSYDRHMVSCERTHIDEHISVSECTRGLDLSNKFMVDCVWTQHRSTSTRSFGQRTGHRILDQPK
jgi:hypothetical protein